MKNIWTDIDDFIITPSILRDDRGIKETFYFIQYKLLAKYSTTTNYSSEFTSLLFLR